MGYYRRGIVQAVRNRKICRHGRRTNILYHHLNRFHTKPAWARQRDDPLHSGIQQRNSIIAKISRVIKKVGVAG